MPLDHFGNWVPGLTSTGENDTVDQGVMSTFTLNADNVSPNLDSQGNYRPQFKETPENDPGPFVGGSGGGGLAGTGSPQGVVSASPGQTYVDVSTNNLWLKVTGTGNTGWFQFTGAGSGGLVGTGSPAGVVSAAAGTAYLDTTGNHFWYKASGSGTSGWVELIA